MLTAALYIFIPMPYLFFGAASDSVFQESSSLLSHFRGRTSSPLLDPFAAGSTAENS